MEIQNHTDLVQTLTDCAAACEYCGYACLHEMDVNMMAQCIAFDHDCADICTLAARLITRNSEIAMQYLLLCEEICRKCAEECGKHDYDHCRRCAEACRNCAEACHANHQPINQD